MVPNRFVLVTSLAAALMFIGCGGGGGGEATTGGNPVTARSSGEIEAFGSVIINGTRFEIQNAEVEFEGERFANQGQAEVEARLRPGMIVEVEAEGTDDNTIRNATRIKFEDTLDGPISAIVETIPGQVKTLTVLGQAVIVENGVTQPSTSFTAFSVGQTVEVSGFPNSTGAINAAFIQAKPAGGVLEITGTVSNLVAGSTFQINALNVNFASAVLSNGAPANGLLVEVKGTLFDPATTTLTATSVEVKTPGLADADEAEVEGFITSLAAPTFVVKGQTVNFANAVFRGGVQADLAVGTKVEAEGEILGGVLLANKVTFKAAIKIEGNLASVTPGALSDTATIQGLPGITVAADDNLTEFRPLNGDPANIPAVGNNVRIRARQSGNLLLAQRFEVVSAQPDNRLILQGLVTSFSAAGGGSVTILGITVDCTQITDANFKQEETAIGRAAFFAGLQAGNVVKARAQLSGSTLTWNEIERELPDSN
jgi:hypothetical protein